MHSINGEGEDEGVVYSEMESVQNTYSEIMSRRSLHLLYGDSGYISCILPLVRAFITTRPTPEATSPISVPSK